MELSAARPAEPEVLVTGTPSDAHTWNLVYLQLLLEELGFRVTNLGPCVPPRLLARRCRAERPGLVVVSSVNGHGLLEGRDVIRALRAVPAMRGVPVVIGGKLGVGGRLSRSEVDGLLADGFDAVFDDGADLAAFRGYLAALPGRPTP